MQDWLFSVKVVLNVVFTVGGGCCLVAKACPTLCDPMDCRPLCPCDFPGKNIEVGCHGLLQEIFLTQGSSPTCPALAGGCFTTEPQRRPIVSYRFSVGNTYSAVSKSQVTWIQTSSDTSFLCHPGTIAEPSCESSVSSIKWKCVGLNPWELPG